MEVKKMKKIEKMLIASMTSILFLSGILAVAADGPT